MHKREVQKKFTFNTEFLKTIVNLETGIIERIAMRTEDEILFESFTFEFDENKTYIRKGNFNARLREYLEEFDSLDFDEDLIFTAEYKTKYKLLELFRESLIESLPNTEHHIERVLKKYEALLPLVIPGINGTAKFQYVIDIEGHKSNRADIKFDDNSEFPNIIELKRADKRLFKKSEYRNNTCRLTPEFSNAIQQTNIQRTMIAAKVKDPNKVFTQSYLLIGNMKDEFEYHELDNKVIQMNFNVVNYNNKDCQIITYDKIINRLDLFLNKMKSTQ